MKGAICRICLEDKACLPIFDDEGASLYANLIFCLQEKIDDITGYPRSICIDCNENLNVACQFIKKYKESCKIIKEGITIAGSENLSIKQEPCFLDLDIYTSDIENNDYNEIKQEKNKDYEKDVKVKPLKINVKACAPETSVNIIHNEDTAKEPKKNKDKKQKINLVKSRKNRVINKTKTNHIASSILETNFYWTGDKWSTLPEPKKQITSEKKTRKQPLVKRKKSTVVIKQDPQLCDLCGITYQTTEQLKNHRSLIHFPQKLKCDKCPKIFKHPLNLKRHVSLKHESKRTYVCSICGNCYAYVQSLRNHNRRVHLNVKETHKCRFCDKSYACKKSVVTHERSAHTGDRPACCPFCDSSFYHEDYLKEHVRLHTGETPFKCPVCNRGYAQKNNMKSHMKQHRLSELTPDIISKIRPNWLKLLKE